MVIRVPAAWHIPCCSAAHPDTAVRRHSGARLAERFLSRTGWRLPAWLRRGQRLPVRRHRGGAGLRPARSFAFALACVLVLVWAPPLSAQVLITGLTDLGLGTWNGISDLQGEDRHCVYASRGGQFNIEARGDGPGSAFALRNGASLLPYEVSYNDGRGWSRMTAGRPLTGQRGAPNIIQLWRCLFGRRDPERVRVRVLTQDLSEALAGGYSGRLFLLVAPE